MGVDLRAIHDALAKLGSPQDKFPCVLVGGTNGKGSTSAMVESIARAGNYRTGLFHSPALGPTHELVRLNGHPVSSDQFAERFLRADQAGDLTWFEAVTVAAFLSFAEEDIELAIVEVGMGGARDCTNVISCPLISAITTIDLDHQQHLGIGLEAIAKEKSGIFRPGQPAYLGWVSSVAEQTVAEEARRIGANLMLCRELLSRIETSANSLDFQQVRFGERDSTSTDLVVSLPLSGLHQAQNAALALLIARRLAKQGFQRIDQPAISMGLEQCRWPGRLEWIRDNRRPVLLDAAHNPAAISTVVNYLQSHSMSSVDFLFGTFNDKDAIGMLRLLQPFTHRLQLTSTHHGRSMPPEQLAALWQSLDSDGEMIIEPSLSIALERAMSAGSGPLCITGSAELVGKARNTLIPRL